MDLDHLTDEDLMTAVQAGDSAAYQVLFRRYQRPVYGYLRRRTGDEQLAAELFQDTWLKVHRGRQTWRPGQPFKPWVFGIALNTMRDSARKAKRTVDTVELTLDKPVQGVDTPTRLTLERAIAELPDTLRDAFLLGVVHGLDHNEVAGRLDISPANARARISRARAHLRKQLRPEGDA